VDEPVVAPGGTGTFQFPIKAPAEAGASDEYFNDEYFNLVAEGLTWFNDPGLYYHTNVIPVVGIAATPTGRGYWLTAADGGVFAFGDAPFLGAATNEPLQAAIASITARSTNGYHLVTASGQVFDRVAAPPPPPPPPTARDRLNPGEALNPSQSLASPNGRYVTEMQTDGNLILYAPGHTAIWASGTQGNPGTVLVNQSDGNLVLVATGNRPIWATGTNGNPGTVLVQQDDGNLVAYAPGNRPIWATNTWRE
jgi:hypothetical protein